MMENTVRSAGYPGPLRILGDQEIALEGAIQGHGAVLIAGTGAICFGRDKAGNRFDAGTPQGRIFQALRRLETLRAEHPAFESGADLWLTETGSDQVLGFGRYAGREQLVGLFNFSDEPRLALVPGNDPFADLISGETGLTGSVSLPAWGFRWLLCDYR